MRKFIPLFLAVGAALSSHAQTNFEEISANPDKTGGLYYLYPVTESANTKAPKGYKPFYISHYGRHGSRTLVNETDYSTPLATLNEADKAGALTDLGKDVKNRLQLVWDDVNGRFGELTPKGVEQHKGIAKRMYHAFPEVFDKKSVMTAKSTTRMRCAHSMAAFCEGLKELEPKLDIPKESGQRYMYYMSNVCPAASEFNKWGNPASLRSDSFTVAKTKSERLMNALFRDSEYLKNKVNGGALMRQIFLIAINQPNTATDVRLDDLFTIEERYDLWQAYNYHYYNHMSNPTSAKGAVLDNARPLLANILQSSIDMIESGNHGADLRFGHDSCIVPLVGLMKVDGCYGSTDDPYKLHEVYADFKISPMAANLQLVFFRNKAGDVIVKLMLNEREVSIPVKTDIAPFYHWTDVKSYFENILNNPTN